jgi:hypothetical protein
MEKYTQIIRECMPQYIQMLSDDFDKNQEYADLFSNLFLDGYPIKKLITEDKIITDFNIWDLKNSTMNYNGTINPIDKLDSIDFQFKHISNDGINDLYKFFEKKEFKDLEKAQKNFNSILYYVYTSDFEKKVDYFFLSNLDDYTKIGKESVKRVNNDVSLIFDWEKKLHSFNSIEQYLLPDLIFKIKDYQEYLFSQTDLTKLLFMPNNSFFAFYFNSYNLGTNNLQIIDISVKDDEPVLYKSSTEKNKYIITNSYENLSRYNKFIYLHTELTIHYLKILEKWFSDIFLLKFENSLN